MGETGLQKTNRIPRNSKFPTALKKTLQYSHALQKEKNEVEAKRHLHVIEHVARLASVNMLSVRSWLNCVQYALLGAILLLTF